MDFLEFIDRINASIGQSDFGQAERSVNANFDRQIRTSEQRNIQRAMKRASEKERLRQNEVSIDLWTTFITQRGFPMQLGFISNVERQLDDYEWLFFNKNDFNGLTSLWRCDPEPNNVRNIFTGITSRKKVDVTWDDFRYPLQNAMLEDLQILLSKDITIPASHKKYANKENVTIKSSDANKMKHVVEMNVFKKNYIKCYNADNGIQDGCFITSAVCDNFGKNDDCYELTMFRNFRDKWLLIQEDGEALIKEYYAIAPRIVSKINLLDNTKEIYHGIWTDYLKPCLLDLESDNKISCKERYVQMVMELKEKYLK